MNLYPIFDAIEHTPLGVGIKESVWLFPAIEAVHLLALAALGGATLVLDLRLVGFGLVGQGVPAIERAARPWQLGALALLVATGTLLFFSEAVKLYYNPSFWVKMSALLLAILFTFLVRNPLARHDRLAGASALAVGALSIALWLVVAAAGRWIGFS